jgi:hypothetical protein
MLIVKPYGKSVTEKNQNKKIALKTNFDVKQDISVFMNTNDDLTIALWVSVIDKIFKKPKPEKKATKKQAKIRMAVGNAAWKILQEKALLSTNQPKLKAVWDWKISPYSVSENDGDEKFIKGRWYETFAGTKRLDEIDPNAIAQEIYSHIYENEKRIFGTKLKRCGRLQGIEKSISQNYLKYREENAEKYRIENAQNWDKTDKKAYFQYGDIAAFIKKATVDFEKNKKVKPSLQIASATLHEHYAKIFLSPANVVLKIDDAKNFSPRLFALHMAVKNAYKDLFSKRTKGKLSQILPSDMEALFRLVDSKNQNKDINSLIRLGKIIHYEASFAKKEDDVKNTSTDWPDKDKIKQSYYWTTSGQIDIKRNEVFVRVWRHFITTASNTLRDWLDPDNTITNEDILSSRKTIEKNPLSSKYQQKLELLFGNRACLFYGTESEQKAVACGAINGLESLRNAAFHFKGLGEFTLKLRAEKAFSPALSKLWESDVSERKKQIALVMEASHFESYFNVQQNQKIFDAITDESEKSVLPLPRFRNVIKRAENTWKEEDKLPLPSCPNRLALEQEPAKHCQYIALKMLYEQAFRAFLAKCSTEQINSYIEKSIARTTAAARKINKNKPKPESLIAAKAEELGKLTGKETISDFLSRLTAATATEMRIQKGYDSDADNARLQAAYIENLKCDIVSLAFCDFLAKGGFNFVLDINADAPANQSPSGTFVTLAEKTATHSQAAEPWQQQLYFLLHLAPVNDASNLLHQLRKWQCTGEKHKGDTQATHQIQHVIELYLDMHDAKFEGGSAVADADSFKPLFESQEGFEAIFPKQVSELDCHIPKRGLREIARFGHISPLYPFYKKLPITQNQVSDYLALEKSTSEQIKLSQIAVWQMQREKLHETLSKQKNADNADILAYFKSLSEITKHRHLAAQVTLTNHIRLHHVLIAVLSRLVDYVGLFERDLYFTTLALMHYKEAAPKQTQHATAAFNSEARSHFKQGQIIQAFNKMHNANNASFDAIWIEIEKLFGNFDACQKIRNDIAHFNMLQSSADTLCLTDWVNKTRQLMAYDRKLKNAVSKSIIDLMQKEGLCLAWEMDNHNLNKAQVSTRQATHLKHLTKLNKRIQAENFHGFSFVQMVAELFGGKANNMEDITNIKHERLQSLVASHSKNSSNTAKSFSRNNKTVGTKKEKKSQYQKSN